ncbi:SNF2 family N-terminal domain-containing protein [Cadophora sp. MPI-SDFR-AT-0126]|nr:SNF2 family N-terminal domain-containing protein [Leotiomycetes sp. MPI-SDFR-AT-0126]
MGLSKTLSFLSLVSWSLDTFVHPSDDTSDVGVSRATLTVTPKSMIPDWQHQIKSHFHAGKLRQVVYHGQNRRQVASNLTQADIVLTTFEALRRELRQKDHFSHVRGVGLFSMKHIMFAIDCPNCSRLSARSPREAGGVLQERQYTTRSTTMEPY